MKFPQQKFTFEVPTPCIWCGNEVKELWATTRDVALEGRRICTDCKEKSENKMLPVQYEIKRGKP